MSKAIPTPPIAIVGISALFPGSHDVAGFWRDILMGRDLIREVPESHWLISDYYDPDPNAPDKTYARRGAFLDPVEFDALAFGIPPTTIPATDTSQLLALVVAQTLLQDAARGQFESMDRSRISVILGVTGAQDLFSTLVSRLQRPVWVKALRESGLPEAEVQAACERIADHYVPWQEASFPGLLGNVVAGRIANRMNLGGTNCVTDAACASAFSAVSMAVNELHLGQSDLVLTGGVDTLNDILMYMCFSKTPALSPSGDCRPFSDQADGTMLGEGLGMVALKRLADAERDGDRIYAVLRGVGTASDGRAKSVYAPVSAGQARALQRAYEQAGYGPESVELMEAHGTGTKAGDAAEFEGLRQVFGPAAPKRHQWCALGSVKSQIGHTKAAAGAAGLIKVVMALQHQVLPPTIKVDAPNPGLDLEHSPFYLSTRTRPWVRNLKHPRRASVSAFGFGGSNFHLSCEEYSGPGVRAERLDLSTSQLLVLSAADVVGLLAQARALLGSTDDLATLARSLQRQFAASAHARLALVVDSRTQLDEKLASLLQRIEAAPEHAFELADGSAFGLGLHAGKVALLFPGQGSQYLGMNDALAMQFAAALAPWDAAANIEFEAGTPLHEVVWPRPGFGPEVAARQVARLTRTEWAQPAIGCVSLSQLALLQQLGLQADMVGGHSFGELSALHAAGALSPADLLKLARRRGELMAQTRAVAGGMLALSLPLAQVEELLAKHAPELVIANHNGPNQVVVSGALSAITAFEQQLQALGFEGKRLAVANAFHSPLVGPASAPFADFMQGISFQSARVPVYANVSAAPYANTPAALRAGLAAQITHPVRFVEMIEAMHADGARTFVEVGPGSVLTGLVGAILGSREHHAVSIDRKGKDGVETLLRALARLLAAGVPLHIEPLYAGIREPRIAPLRSKSSIAISGSNHGKRYPPSGGSQALPPPNPPRPVALPMTETSIPPMSVLPAITPQPLAAPAPTPSALTQSPTVSAAWLQAFQESQQQTAAAHAAFQQSMFDSHAAYLKLAESALSGLRELAGVAGPVDMPVQAAVSRLAPAAVAPAPSLPTIATTMAPPVLAAPAPADVVPPSTPVAATFVAPVSADNGMEQLLLGIVADKTGYPLDMLNLDMDLEGDLGIDSIKRVEILAALDERTGGRVKPQRSSLAGLHTLAQILGRLQPHVGTSSSVACVQAAAVDVPKSAGLQANQPTVERLIDLRSLLLEIVADKTGYPLEMLNLEMDLEGDLGIDSIKRVEILAALDERSEGLVKPQRSSLAGLHTLAQILQRLQPQAGTSSSVACLQAAAVDVPKVAGLQASQPTALEVAGLQASQPTALEVAGLQASQPTALEVAGLQANQPIGRYCVRLLEAPASGMAQPGLLAGNPVWISGAPGLNEALAAELSGRGVNAQVCENPPLNAGACVYLGGLRPLTRIEEAIAVNREAFVLARRLAPHYASHGGLLVSVQDTGGRFGFGHSDPQRAWLAGLPALLKTAALEWPQAALKAIDLEMAGRDPRVLAVALADELLLGGGEIEVGLPAAGGRFTLCCVAEPVVAGTPLLGPADVVLVSGGARGVTAACLAELARQSRARFVLLGRTSVQAKTIGDLPVHDETALKHTLLAQARERGQNPTPAELLARVRQVRAEAEVHQCIAAIAAAGGQARYEMVSVTDAAALGRTLTRVRSDWGPVTALIHAAGVLADKRIADKTDAQFNHVFDTKVQGLRALLAATESDPLKLLCVFSSVSARCGNTGQADYAMANEVLNKVALAYAAGNQTQDSARARPGLKVKALGWGPWAGGMVGPELAAHFRALGVPMIPLDTGARMLAAELNEPEGGPIELVLGGEPRPEALLSEGAQARVMQLELSVQRATHEYLEGHAVNGLPVVPVVLVAEWLARAARGFAPGLQLHALHEFKVLRGIRLHGFENGGDRLLLQASPVPGSGGWQMLMQISDLRGQAYFRARAELSPEPRAAGDQTQNPDRAGVQELPALPIQAWDGAPLYQELLFHRGRFELIEQMDGISDHGAGALVRGVAHADWQGEPWLLDVAALDGGLQLAVLYGQRMLGGPNLPTSIEQIRCFDTVRCPGPIHAAAYGRQLGPSAVSTDIVFTDSKGQRLAELRGVHNHALPQA